MYFKELKIKIILLQFNHMLYFLNYLCQCNRIAAFFYSMPIHKLQNKSLLDILLDRQHKLQPFHMTHNVHLFHKRNTNCEKGVTVFVVFMELIRKLTMMSNSITEFTYLHNFSKRNALRQISCILFWLLKYFLLP